MLFHAGCQFSVAVTRWTQSMQLVPRWVTICGRVKHLDAEPGTQAYSP